MTSKCVYTETEKYRKNINKLVYKNPLCSYKKRKLEETYFKTRL